MTRLRSSMFLAVSSVFEYMIFSTSVRIAGGVSLCAEGADCAK